MVALDDAATVFDLLCFLEDPAVALTLGAARLIVLVCKPLKALSFLTGLGASEATAMGSRVLPGAVMIFTLLLW